MFTDSEIEKFNQLKKLKLQERANCAPRAGSFFIIKTQQAKTPHDSFARLSEDVYVMLLPSQIPDSALWLLTFDELLSAARNLNVSFSQITDYIHRKRFADGREREGLCQLLIESLR